MIKTWETFINSSICLFYTKVITYFPALPYRQHFVEVCFRFVQTTVFLSSLLHFIINQFQTFIDVYKLYFVLVQNVHIALENVQLVPLLSSVFCYLLRFLKNRALSMEDQYTCLVSLIKTAPKKSWWASAGTSLLSISESFHISFDY